MSDLELLQALLCTHLGGRDLADEDTWQSLADRHCEGQRAGIHFRCGKSGVALTQDGVERFVPWSALAQPSLFEEMTS